jgi:hypothetical protein
MTSIIIVQNTTGDVNTALIALGATCVGTIEGYVAKSPAIMEAPEEKNPEMKAR